MAAPASSLGALGSDSALQLLAAMAWLPQRLLVQLAALLTVAPAAGTVSSAIHAAGTGSSAGTALLESSLAKPSPDRPWRGGASSWSLLAAKNEYESFLVVINGPLQSVTVNPPKYGLAARSMAFAARYVNATKASGCLGRAGLVMDPLVPDIDVFDHEKRNAFPMDVPAGESRVVWVDVFVPASSPAGTTHAPVIVHHAAGNQSLGVTLTVLGFALPSTPSLSSLFGFGGAEVVMQAHETGPALAAQLVDKYVQAGLANRVSHADWFAHATMADQLAAGDVNDSFREWATHHAPKYDGMDVPGPAGQASLRGARLTSAQLPVPFCAVQANRSGFIKHNCTAADVAAQIDYWRQLHAAWKTRGWADLLFD
jgi:hypothetical protein